MLSEQEFQHIAGAAMEDLFSALADAAERFDFDVDLSGGALTVEFDSPRERFIVSPNSSVRQIWVSAHVQSFKLDWAPDARAFVLADGRALAQLLEDSIRQREPDFVL